MLSTIDVVQRLPRRLCKPANSFPLSAAVLADRAWNREIDQDDGIVKL